MLPWPARKFEKKAPPPEFRDRQRHPDLGDWNDLDARDVEQEFPVQQLRKSGGRVARPDVGNFRKHIDLRVGQPLSSVPFPVELFHVQHRNHLALPETVAPE